MCILLHVVNVATQLPHGRWAPIGVEVCEHLKHSPILLDVSIMFQYLQYLWMYRTIHL